ncbi:hypothetical protein Tco_0764807 [Tanacetum coccineum]
MKVVPNEEEVAVDAIPLATKPPSIMLRSFDSEDLKTLWKLKIQCGGIYKETECWFGSYLIPGRIVRIKRLLDDLRVTAAKLMLLVQKLLLLVLKVNVAGMKVTTAGRVYADREEIKDLSEKV